MARIPITDAIEDLQRFLNEVLGSEAEFVTPELAVRNLMMAYRRVAPMAPNDWQDGDTLANQPFALPHALNVQGFSSGVPWKALPSDLLELRGIVLSTGRSQMRLMHDINEFNRAKSLMTAPVSGLLHLIAIRQGDNLHYWYNPSTDVWANISYVRDITEPNLSGGVFLCSQRMLPLVISCAAARGKWGEMKPQEAQLLNNQFLEDIAMAFQLERRKKTNDPYTSAATEQRLGA